MIVVCKLIALIFIFYEIFAVEVVIKQGRLRGKVGLDANDREYYSFQSIPYAQSPVGILRFKDPEPPTKWNGTLDATFDLVPCPQVVLRNIIGQEDCLYLNVFTPYLPNKTGYRKPLPVMFYIFGGGFIQGSGNEKGPEHLMPYDVVLVTINYRVGFLGFISSKNVEIGVPGNAGLKDQTMALIWVRENIVMFGGDPNSVTIFGISAGGVSVHLHMLSQLSAGLFHKAIAMSGIATHQWSEGILGTFEEKAKALGIYSNNSTQMLNDFQGMPVEEILQLQRQNGYMIPIHESFECAPVVEQRLRNAFLPHDRLEMIRKGMFNRVPFMFGFTNSEGLVYQVEQLLYNESLFFPSDYYKLVPHDFKLSDQEYVSFVKNLDEYYYDQQEPNEENLERTTNLVTGIWWMAGFVRFFLAAHDYNRFYFYRFNADTKLNYVKCQTNITAAEPGACHGDELGYLFNYNTSPEIKHGSREHKAMSNLLKFFTNFARYGRPTQPQEKLQWKPMYTNDKLIFMNIDSVSKPGDMLADIHDLEFWRNMYNEFVRHKREYIIW